MGSTALRHPARLAGASLLRLQNDERLTALALDGHEAAFAAIVDRYRAPLLRYCAGIVGADRAEDALQQTFINAHAALSKTTDVQHLRSWIYRIAHNASLNVLRAVRDDVPLDASHGAPTDGPDAAVERAEQLRATLRAVAGLPERQRAALLLRELEGRSHEEIADALGVTAGSARQHLMRARAAVRSAVTALTPYPLIAKLATSLATAGPGVGSWGEAAAGAGGGAVLAKFTAGVMATGALVGGAVGTEHLVSQHREVTPPALRDVVSPATPPAAQADTVPAAAVSVGGAATAGAGAASGASAGARHGVTEGVTEGRRHGRHRGRHGSHGESSSTSGDDSSSASGSGKGSDEGKGHRGRGKGSSSESEHGGGSGGGRGAGGDNGDGGGHGSGSSSGSGSGKHGGDSGGGSGKGSGGSEDSGSSDGSGSSSGSGSGDTTTSGDVSGSGSGSGDDLSGGSRHGSGSSVSGDTSLQETETTTGATVDGSGEG